MEHHDLAQDHVNAIYALSEYLLESCGDRFTKELDDRVQSLHRSFDAYRGIEVAPAGLADVKYENALGRNYLVAQCSLLLAFAHEAKHLIEAGDSDPLKDIVSKLRSDLSACYEKFFGLNLPF